MGEHMDRIWAPWRMTYLTNPVHEDGCIFCKAWNEVEEDRNRLVLFRTEQSFVMLNRYPYTCGHLMVASARHTAELDDFSDAEQLDLMQCVRKARALLRKVARPDGFNVGMNLGKAAGAAIVGHLHIHIVPRWNGDTNFMSVSSDVRVMPEGLFESYDRLREALGV